VGIRGGLAFVIRTVGDGHEPRRFSTWGAKAIALIGKLPDTTIPDMHGKIFATATQKRLSHAGAASQQKKMLPAGAICVSCIATPGLVVIAAEPAHTNQQINTVVPSRRDETYFWFWALRSLGDKIQAGGSGGSVLTNLSTGHFAELNVLSPPPGIRSSYHFFVAPAFGRILESERESRTLASLRDTLLPKLISGELRVEDAERPIAQAI
jgi:type I restriction enzyme S subunit